MATLGDCPNCETDLSGYELSDLPHGSAGLACPECETDVYCGYCGNLTV